MAGGLEKKISNRYSWNMKKRGLLVTGGSAPEKLVLPEGRETWYVVAADSGLTAADRWGIVPDLIVGDMDSVEPSLLARYCGTPIERHPPEKDQTDTEIGLSRLWGQGFNRVTIAGGDGGRIDHFIGILRIFERVRYPKRWILKEYSVEVIDDDAEISCEVGEELSFFPSGALPCRSETTGLKWELNGLEWGPGDVGISNVCVDPLITIRILSGRLLMVRKNRGIIQI
jgi:thiamine pyrophosphokinase